MQLATVVGQTSSGRDTSVEQSSRQPTRQNKKPLLASRRPLRVDFALITLTGNLTRYQTVRPLVDAMREVSARWYPIRTWVAGDWTHIFPGLLRIRLRHLLDSW